MSNERFLFRSSVASWSREAFAELAASVEQRLQMTSQVAVHTEDPVLVNAAIVAASDRKVQLQLVHSVLRPEVAVEWARRFGAVALLGGTSGAPLFQMLDTTSRPSDGSWLGIYTSGTSGEPKLSMHDWTTVQRPAHFASRDLADRTWLMTYSPTSYAGLQVFFAAYNNGGRIVYRPQSLAETCRAIVHEEVEVISATPTFWRLIANAWPAGLPRPKLIQATLGGEIVSQDVLDLVSDFFRPRRITHIYASTETGPAIVVSDGLAGFPSDWLERSDRPVQLRIQEDQLEVRSPFRMTAYAARESENDAGWFRTPDRVAVSGGRVVFTGRSDTIVNVGGRKIPVEQIEGAIRAIPAVAESRVYMKKSPVVGQLLAADVVVARGATIDVAEIKRQMKMVLDDGAVPQIVRIVGSLELATSGKKRRG